MYFFRCLSSSSFYHSKQENLGVVEGGGEWEEVEGFGGERGCAEKLGGLLAGLYLIQGPAWCENSMGTAAPLPHLPPVDAGGWV